MKENRWIYIFLSLTSFFDRHGSFLNSLKSGMMIHSKAKGTLKKKEYHL